MDHGQRTTQWRNLGQTDHHPDHHFADDEFAWIAEMDTAPRRPCGAAAGATPQAMLSRRGLIAAASGAGVASLSGHLWFLVASRGRSRSILDADTFATLCSGWRYPMTIGNACLAALPANETSKGSLTRMILGDVKAAGLDCLSASALAYAIRELSRDDFRRGRIVTVDGWMLSLTETRAYALAALLPQPGRNPTFMSSDAACAHVV